jgi:hypothetical protein
MLRSTTVAFLTIALATLLGSGSANATATVFGSLSYDLRNLSCPPPGGCAAELTPSNPTVEVGITANPGTKVDETDTVDFLLDLTDPNGVAADVTLHVEYRFLITFTDPTRDLGSYIFNDAYIGYPQGCSYPPGGQFSGQDFSCGIQDFNDFSFYFTGDETIAFAASIDAHAASIAEPSSVGMLAPALLVFGWLHRKQTMPTRSTSSG